jgi:hypothetical protein
LLHEQGDVRSRRILPVPALFGEGLLTEPTRGAQPWRRELALMPPLPSLESYPGGGVGDHGGQLDEWIFYEQERARLVFTPTCMIIDSKVEPSPNNTVGVFQQFGWNGQAECAGSV